MNSLKTLIALQIKDKIDMSFTKNKKTLILKSISTILKFILITALIYAGFYLVSAFRLTSYVSGIPQDFMNILLSVMILLSIITCTMGLVKTLYYAKDNALLLTLPARKEEVFFSKIVVYFIYELVRNISFFLPVLIAFGLINTYSILFYIYIIFSTILLTMLIVSISAFLSIGAMLLTNVFKSFSWIKYITIIASLALFVWGFVALINLIPENFNLITSWSTIFAQIQNLFEWFNQTFAILTYVVCGIVGTRFGNKAVLFDGAHLLSMGGMILFIVLIAVFTWFCIRPLFFKMANSTGDHKKTQSKQIKHNKKTKTIFSVAKKECLIILRSNDKLFGLMGVCIAIPLCILLLNTLYKAIDLRLTGTNITIAFNIFIILLIALASNCAFAHIFSEDGASGYLNKTAPQNAIVVLFGKLIPNLICVSLAIFITCFVLKIYLDFSISTTLLLFAYLLTIYVSHALNSAELDFMNPQNRQYQTTGTHTNNPNDAKSTIYAFVAAAIFAFIAWFFISERPIVAYQKMCILSILFLALRSWIFSNKIRHYFKEDKQ